MKQKKMTPAELFRMLRENPEEFIGKRVVDKNGGVGLVIGVTNRGFVIRPIEN